MTAVELAWTRTMGDDGAVFTSGKFVVRKVRWTPPGFGKKRSWGWALFVEGEQVTAAYPRAADAQRRATTWRP
jgi:hypothetical protein